MRKSKLLILSAVALGTLVGCGQNGDPNLPKTPEEIVAYVLGQLKGDSHELRFEEELKILRPNDKYAVDIYQQYIYEYGYFYSDNGVDVAKAEETFARYADLDKKTGLIDEITLRTASTPKQTYYRNNEDGTALLKAVSLQNEVETYVLAYQDQEEGTFIPVIYDEEFTNPFDFITTRDLVYNAENKTIVIDNSKASFIASTYKAVGLNLISSCYITLDDKFVPQTIEFDIPDLVEATYTRTNKLKVTFTNLDVEYYEVKAFNHKNDTLGAALKELKGAKNYTYYKDYVYEGQSYDLISGFYTEDMIYFHHGTIEDGDVYKTGDNYDYVAKKNADGIFEVYDCTTEDGINFNWKIVMASNTTPLTYETFEECAPSYFDISANIFKDLGNNKYECEEQLLPTIGQYFDYGVWGVDSYALESQTNRCVITLSNEGKIDTVEIGFKLENIQYDIVYSYDNIGSTTIPSWLEFPH